MQVATHTPPYPADSAHHTQQVWIAVLLALLLHVLVLIAVYSRPADKPYVQMRSIDISLEASTANEAPLPEKRIVPPKPQPLPEPPPAAQAAPQATEVPPPVPAAPSPSPASPAPAPEIQPLSRLTRLPGFLRKVEAVYPASERRAGIQANVLAEVTIDMQGRVQDVRIIKSAGSAFDIAVTEALKKSIFTPGYINDQAVPVHFQVPFRFNLN